MKTIALFTFSYLLGGIPFGLIVGKTWRGIDIRQTGSGNIGATNVLRTLGPGPAALVFALDVLKGLVPVVAAQRLFPDVQWIVVASGVLAVLGHTLSPFLRFKGGKGVATSLGVVIGMSPAIAGMGFAIWLVVVLITRYVSLASIIAVACTTALMWILDAPRGFTWFTTLAAAFVICKHRSNISRLLQGKEHRFIKQDRDPEE